MSRCCPVKQFLFWMRPCCRSSSAITGASLIVSGRVPNTVRVLSMRTIVTERRRVEVVLDRPADLAAGDVFRAFAVAAEETAGGILDRLEVLQGAIGAIAIAQAVPDDCVLRHASRAHPAHVRVGGHRAIAALHSLNLRHADPRKVHLAELAEGLHGIGVKMGQPIETQQSRLSAVIGLDFPSALDISRFAQQLAGAYQRPRRIDVDEVVRDVAPELRGRRSKTTVGSNLSEHPIRRPPQRLAESLSALKAGIQTAHDLRRIEAVRNAVRRGKSALGKLNGHEPAQTAARGCQLTPVVEGGDKIPRDLRIRHWPACVDDDALLRGPVSPKPAQCRVGGGSRFTKEKHCAAQNAAGSSRPALGCAPDSTILRRLALWLIRTRRPSSVAEAQ